MSTAQPTTAPNGCQPVQFGEPQWHADGALLALAYAADGALWSVEEPGALRRWDRSGRLLDSQVLSDLETLWAFGPRAELVASASDELIVWEVAGSRQIATLEQPSWITAIAFHPTRRVIATGHDDGGIRVWDLAVGGDPVELAHHDQPISALAFNAGGSMLASAAEDRRIGVWDLPAGSFAGRSPGTQTESRPWHGNPERTSCSRPGGTPRSASGTSKTAIRCCCSTPIPTKCIRWHSVQTGNCSRSRIRPAPCMFGARLLKAKMRACSPVMSRKSIRSHFLRTASCWRSAATTWSSTYGTHGPGLSSRVRPRRPGT